MFSKENLTPLAEKMVATFLQAFLGIVAAGPMVGMEADVWKAGAASGVAACLSVLKSYVATKRGDGSTDLLK
tara:strand:- start:78 stop:293 length:216 start_codon:yes stop_codon:yes gene_type:complete